MHKETGENINLPLDNLEWSTLFLTESGNYVPRMYWKSISPNTYQYCNLGYIMEPEFRRMNPGEDNQDFVLEEYECLFAFNVYWKTNDKRHILKSGCYTFEVTAGCENGKPISRRYKMEFTGFWNDDEKTMLKNEIKIEEINC